LDSYLIAPRAAVADWDYYERPLKPVLRGQRIGKFQKYTTTWVKAKILSGDLKVVDLHLEGERRGFMLLCVDDGGLVRSCVLWMGYMEAGEAAAEAAWPELRRWAKRFRCPIVEFVSSRPGLWRKAPQHGWAEIYRGFAAEV